MSEKTFEERMQSVLKALDNVKQKAAPHQAELQNLERQKAEFIEQIEEKKREPQAILQQLKGDYQNHLNALQKLRTECPHGAEYPEMLIECAHEHHRHPSRRVVNRFCLLCGGSAYVTYNRYMEPDRKWAKGFESAPSQRLTCGVFTRISRQADKAFLQLIQHEVLPEDTSDDK